MSAKKRSVSDDDDDDSSSLTSLEDEAPKKVSKKKKLDNDGDNKSKKSDSSRIKGPNGEKLLDLSGRKFVSVTQFRNRTFVDIREYYEDSSTGKLKPGKKGVALNREQWVKLKSMIDEVDADLENRL